MQPSGNATVTLTLPPTTDCAAQDAICTSDGKKFTSRFELEVPDPATPTEPVPQPQPLTASIHYAPTAYAGSTLTFELRSSEESVLTHKTLRILGREAQCESAKLSCRRWPARRSMWLGPVPDDAAPLLTQQRVGGDQPPGSARPRERGRNRSEQAPVSVGELGSVDLAAQHT